MFLAKTLPLTHRSGCNIRGFLNTTNATSIDDQVDVETEAGQFYHQFWTLQKFFNNPVLLFKPGQTITGSDPYKSQFLRFLDVVSGVIEQFRQSGGCRNSKIIEKYPKYLTKFSLMQLQKDDASIRIVFCIQVLVLVQTLCQPILVEQKRDLKITDDEKVRLNEVKADVLSLILANDS